MTTDAADDPIRAEVERVLHAAVGQALALPTRLASTVPACIRRQTRVASSLVEPWRIARSVVTLLTGQPASGDAPARPASSPVDGTGDTGAEVSPDPDDAATDDERASSAGPALPIDDYESLAASHVVDRLPMLTTQELLQLHEFETAHRGRRTVLGRIEQLLA